MKELWLVERGEDWEKVREKVIDAIETGFSGVIVREEFVEKAMKLGKINVAGIYRKGDKGNTFIVGIDSEGEGLKEIPEDFSGSYDYNVAVDLKERKKKVYAYVRVRDEKSQRFAVEMSRLVEHMFLDFEDWKIIPLENLIAFSGDTKVISKVSSLDDAKTAIETLEKGSDGVFVEGWSREEMGRLRDLLRVQSVKKELIEAEVVEVRKLGSGMRVCIDTVELLELDEGMLIGSSSGFLFLIGSESEESEYASARPFRVNAGAVSMYIRIGEETRYLAELKAGDMVEIIRNNGASRMTYTGRTKVERRPLVLIRARSDDMEGSVILQNAETVKLISPEGRISVSDLKEGDRILVSVEREGRHFGVKVEETIIER